MAVLEVEVVHALPRREASARLRLPEGSVVRDALRLSGLLPLAHGKVGIFGKVVDFGAPLADGDRIEVYRPLAADPKEARRRRAARR
jgi:putative ubiquitin-RnfH superfamily antitoxin RatB of RatAB toxin-antitoxin module